MPITIREGDRLWPLMRLFAHTHIDDLPDYRLRQLEELVDSWRITDAEGRPITRAALTQEPPTMDHYTARDLLKQVRPTWGQLRDHMMNRYFDSPDSLPDTSNVNPAVPIGRAWDVYDRAIADRNPDEPVDILSARDELLAANIVRDFGIPRAAITREGE